MVNFMQLHFEKMIPYIPKYLEGLKLTLQLTLVSLIAALLLAIILVLLGFTHSTILKKITGFYISFFRGVPVIVQLFLIHFGISGLTNNAIVLPTVVSGEITFALNCAAYLAESIRGGVGGVDKGQQEAAKALGIGSKDLMLYIIAPQALRVVLPSLINTSIKLVKDSAIISQLGAFDLMRSSYYAMSNSYKAFESLIICAGFYLTIVISLTLLSKVAEKRLNRSEIA